MKIWGFRWLEFAAYLRQRLRGGRDSFASALNEPAPPERHRRGSLWVFTSTIGELNLAEPILSGVASEFPGLPITLITNHCFYLEAYRRKYPDAYVHAFGGDTRATKALAAITPPLAALVVEIPCLPSDAPCRLPYAFLYELRRRERPAVLINGWLYGYAPPSILDSVERSWFKRDYVRAFSAISVQTESVKEALLGAGASPGVVHVTGNIKFDALRKWKTRSGGRLRAVAADALQLDGARPTIVAGCVTDPRDQRMVLDAFEHVRRVRTNVLLVIAPRHPEKAAVMEQLDAELVTRGMRSVLRTEQGGRRLSSDVHCLVLDTFGELTNFYEASTSAFVGRNHNLLEPLIFGRPTTTSGVWDPTYPSFPVYAALREAIAIRESASALDLAEVWLKDVASDSEIMSPPPQSVQHLDNLLGATERNLILIRRLFSGLGGKADEER